MQTFPTTLQLRAGLKRRAANAGPRLGRQPRRVGIDPTQKKLTGVMFGLTIGFLGISVCSSRHTCVKCVSSTNLRMILLHAEQKLLQLLQQKANSRWGHTVINLLMNYWKCNHGCVLYVCSIIILQRGCNYSSPTRTRRKLKQLRRMFPLLVFKVMLHSLQRRKVITAHIVCNFAVSL